MFIIKRMNESISSFLLKLQSLLVSIIINTWNQTYLSSVTLGCLYFRNRSTFRKTNQRFYAMLRSTKCNTLRMISR